MIETAASWTLPDASRYHRETARAPHLRPSDFVELFDAHTVFYDCFRISASQVVLLAPPLVRFTGILDSLTIHVEDLPCSFHVEHMLTKSFANRQTHNLCRIFVNVPEEASALRLRCEAGDTTLSIAPEATTRFTGKRVLLTLSRNNDPIWVCDWMRFHRDVQQADAVLLYDNGSTAYSTRELLHAMQQVSGFSAITVVEWPFKYGPQGIGRGTWDSAFCQNGALEDARWRFLRDAFAVLSCDIDELTLCFGSNIFDRAARSRSGYVKFAGRWVNSPDVAADLPRHRDSTYQLLPRWRWRGFKLKDLHLSPPKWAVVPARCPHDAHWSVHEIVGMKMRRQPLRTAGYRHFQKISTHWKKTRAHSNWSNGKGYKTDLPLKRALRAVHWSS